MSRSETHDKASKDKLPKVGQGHRLAINSGYNIRELGGYDTPEGTTVYQRFLRSGDTSDLSAKDIDSLLNYGVSQVIDLRGNWELRSSPDPFERVDGVSYLNVPLFDSDLSDPKLRPADTGEFFYGLGSGYLSMLSNKPGIGKLFHFIAQAPMDSCVLFHCAAGMDRTGVTAMLLLALAGVDRDHIIADYLYSFGSQDRVDAFVFGDKAEQGQGSDSVRRSRKTAARKGVLGVLDRLRGRVDSDDYEESPRFWGGSRGSEFRMRSQTISLTYDRMVAGYGDALRYLRSCDLSFSELEQVRARLLVK